MQIEQPTFFSSLGLIRCLNVCKKIEFRRLEGVCRIKFLYADAVYLLGQTVQLMARVSAFSLCLAEAVKILK